MLIFETVIALLLAGALLAILAKRLCAPYPALLALAGTAGALVPGLPNVTLDPELALALFVAPTLLDAAYDASPRDLKANWVAVTGLVLVCVLCTAIAVAWVAGLIQPGLPWAAAIALGAIVAPPDASAAATVLRQLRPPHRVLVVLEGESLLNDASARLVYRVAVGAAMGGAVGGWQILPMLLLTCGGGALLGVAMARLWVWLNPNRQEIAIAVLIQFLGTFAVWLLERLAVPDDGAIGREVALARRETTEAAIAALNAAAPAAAAELLRREHAARLAPARGGGEELAGLQRQAVAAQRRRLVLLRSRGRIGDDAFHQLEEEIDLLDLTADARIRDLRAPQAPA